MAVLILGVILIIVGALTISFPELCDSLKTRDPDRWAMLGSPYGHSFLDLGKSIGVFSWVLSRGFESSSSPEVAAVGNRAYRKALIAKYSLLSGVVFLVAGFGLSLAGVWV